MSNIEHGLNIAHTLFDREGSDARIDSSLDTRIEHNVSNQYIYSLDEVTNLDASIIGGKALNLGKLKKAGLSVPDGFCLTTEAYDYFLQTGELPITVLSQIENIKSQLGGSVTVRSSATCEDGDRLSMAGVFQSIYVHQNEDVVAAVQAVYTHSMSQEVIDFMKLHDLKPTDMKMGIIIQQLIQPDMAGVIYTGVNDDKVLVQYVDGFGAALVDGEADGSTILLNSNGSINASTGFESRPLTTDLIHQIQDSASTIEALYGGDPQDIEFAASGDKLYILQARKLTASLGQVEIDETLEECLERTKYKLRELVQHEKQELGTTQVIFSDSNFSELLPRATEMDFGVFAYIFTGSDNIPGGIQLGRIDMGYPLGSESVSFMSYIGGRAYLSIARDAATFYAGFPDSRPEYFDTLVTEYLTSIQADPAKGSYPEMGLYLQDPTLEDLQSRFGDKAENYFQVYQDFVIKMRRHADSFIDQYLTQELPQMQSFIESMKTIDLDAATNAQIADYCTQILEHLRTRSCVNFVKSARLGFYYSQRLQSLLKDSLGLDTDESERIFARLSQGLEGSAITDVNITIAEAITDEEALHLAQELVGHYSTGEMLEIRHPRLKDDQNALLAYALGIRQTGTYKSEFEKQKNERLSTEHVILSTLRKDQKLELENIIHSAQTYMALRETIKYLFTKEYSLIRDGLQILESRLSLDRGDIYYLSPRQIPELLWDPSSLTHLIKSRQRSFLNYANLDLPAVIRESDIDEIHLKTAEQDDFVELKGKFLAEGPSTEGIIINLDQFSDLKEASSMIEEYQKQNLPIILVATQMNLGHDPFIAISSGLILENAGIVSHGAQRARELGKGAIGGIKSSKLITGTKVLFDPINRLVSKVD